MDDGFAGQMIAQNVKRVPFRIEPIFPENEDGSRFFQSADQPYDALLIGEHLKTRASLELDGSKNLALSADF